MREFYEQHGSRKVKSRVEGLVGAVAVYTKITIKGNYKKGPVPVSVGYGFAFSPDSGNYATDPTDPEDEPWSWTETLEYETP